MIQKIIYIRYIFESLIYIKIKIYILPMNKPDAEKEQTKIIQSY